MAAPAAVAFALALSLVLAGALPQHDLGGGAPHIEMLRAGSHVEPPLVELYASPEPAGLELVASGVGGGAEVSVRVVRSSGWGGAPGASPPVTLALTDHGGGEATMTLDRSSPGDVVVEASAVGDSGAARALYVVRVLDALPPPGGHDGAAPSRIVGHLDPADPALPRILAQAGRPVCAGEAAARGAGMRVPEAVRDGWRGRPTMSGVPPIEGMAMQQAQVQDPADDGTSDHPSWWGCYTVAVFGTQAPQWIHLCDVPGSDRTRYYARQLDTGGGSAASWAINPHNGDLTGFSHRDPHPQAAAPGPHWFRTRPDQYSGYPPPGFDPHAPIPQDALVPFGELFFVASGKVKSMWTLVDGTFSWVPELLPLDGRVVLRATAFHSDNVTFRTEQPQGAPPALPGLPATVNGTHVPTRPVPEPHSLHQDGRHYFQNGTAVPHHGRAHSPGASAAGLQGVWEPHWHSPPHVAVSVRVSDIALRNGVLIAGITDGIADLPRERQLELLRARGVPDGLDVERMGVKRLHEVTLVAELPVGVPDGEYEGAGPGVAVAPWECWPRLYHPAACMEGTWDWCPTGRSGVAWVP